MRKEAIIIFFLAGLLLISACVSPSREESQKKVCEDVLIELIEENIDTEHCQLLCWAGFGVAHDPNCETGIGGEITIEACGVTGFKRNYVEKWGTEEKCVCVYEKCN